MSGFYSAGLFDVIPDSVVAREDDNNSTSQTDNFGFEIELKADWPSIGARISNNTSGLTRAILQEDDGTNIETIDISGLSAGEAFTFDDVDLQDGNKYRIITDAEGSSFTHGFFDGSQNYPYTTADIDITNRIRDGSVDQGSPGNINDIGNVGFD